MRVPPSLAVLASCWLLPLVTSNALAQLAPATYNGVVTSTAYPSSNPNCNAPVVSCTNSQPLTAPGTITVNAPGTSLETGQLTYGTLGPSISVSATSSALTSSWVRGSSRAQGILDYFVEIVGPAGNVPVNIAVSGGVSASNTFYQGLVAGTQAGVSMMVSQSGPAQYGTLVACATDPNDPPSGCLGQQSFSGTYSFSFAANTPIAVELNALAWTYSVTYVGTYSAYIDPIFSIDPGFANAGAYTILISPGITQALPSLTVTKSGSGSGTVTSSVGAINCGATCSDTYAGGTAITLTAAPAGGNQFTGWLGPCTGVGTCNFTFNGSTMAVATFASAPAGTQVLNVDGNGSYDALTDGLLAIRYLFGLSGAALITGVEGAGATRITATDVGSYLTDIKPFLDIDGNGQADVSTDGLLIARYLFGLRGASLIAGAIGPNAIRTTAAAIETQIQTLMP
jgi:hypothetical protein